MSVDFLVVPTINSSVNWDSLKRAWLNNLDDELKKLIETGEIFPVNTKEYLSEFQQLNINRFYNFEFKKRNTIGLDIFENKMVELSEGNVIEDFGRNLKAEDKERITSQWYKCAYSISVISQAGRPKYEDNLVVALLSALAHCYQGYIVVLGNFFGLEVGIYDSVTFSKARKNL